VVLAVFWLAGRFLNTFSGVFLPLAVAGITALVFDPYYEWLCRICRGQRVVAMILLFGSMLIPIVIAGAFLGSMLIEQASSLLVDFEDKVNQVRADISQRYVHIATLMEKWGLNQQIDNFLKNKQGLLDLLQKVSGKAYAAGASVFRAMSGMLSWAVFPIYFAFFLYAKPVKPKNFESLLPFLKSETRDDVVYLGREFVNIIVAFFRGQLLVAFGQGVLFAIGFMLVQLPYGLVIGLLLGFLNIIPYLGSMIGLSIALPLAYFGADGGLTQLILVLVVFGIVQVIEGYVLTPRVMGEKTGLHPMAIIISIFFWGAALDGIMGMILAIPLTAFLVIFWRLLKKKYISGIV
ncbi:MAG: AI-2E family transporter, partial [Verrucomicrobiota bacterium]